jgi:hypothetical protein
MEIRTSKGEHPITSINDEQLTGDKKRIVVACTLFTSKKVKDIKFTDTSNSHSLFSYLKESKAIVETTMFGTEKVTVVGHFVQVAPRLVWRNEVTKSVSRCVDDILTQMSTEEICSLDPTSQSYYTQSMENGDHFIPTPPPFDIVTTYLGYGTANSTVTTSAPAVRCEAKRAPLLRELLNRAAKAKWPNYPLMEFLPNGLNRSANDTVVTNMLASQTDT